MPNLRHPGTGTKLLHQVLRQTGSRVKHITGQIDPNTAKLKKSIPTKIIERK